VTKSWMLDWQIRTLCIGTTVPLHIANTASISLSLCVKKKLTLMMKNQQKRKVRWY
jgi:hypothetical protein